jgi:hypothetical protein
MAQSGLVGTPRCGVRSAQKRNNIEAARFAGCADPTFGSPLSLIDYKNGHTWFDFSGK